MKDGGGGHTCMCACCVFVSLCNVLNACVHVCLVLCRLVLLNALELVCMPCCNALMFGLGMHALLPYVNIWT